MARAIAQRKSRELWTEVNKLKSSKSHSTNCMDDVTGSEQIAKIFSDKYCELYNSASYENLQLANIISDITVDVKMYCMTEHNSTCTVNKSITHTYSVTPDMIQSFINKIKHGVTPGGLLLSTLVPIPQKREGTRQTLIIIEQLQLVAYWENCLI